MENDPPAALKYKIALAGYRKASELNPEWTEPRLQIESLSKQNQNPAQTK